MPFHSINGWWGGMTKNVVAQKRLKNTALTCPGSTGANHMCLPSLVLLTPSISLSGVLTSPHTLSRTLTLSGKAAMSGARREVEEHRLSK